MIWKNPPIATNMDSNSKELYILLCFEIEFRKCRTTKGDTMHKLLCVTKCSFFLQYILFPQPKQPAQHFCIFAVLASAALPHFKRGTAAVSAALPHLD
jgi:hypothetical protein